MSPTAPLRPNPFRILPNVNFQQQLDDHSPAPDWHFQAAELGSVSACFARGRFSSCFAARLMTVKVRAQLNGAGAFLVSDNLEPWIQVVSSTSTNTRVVPDLFGVDPIQTHVPPADYDNLPFYWTAAKTGNAATNRLLV